MTDPNLTQNREVRNERVGPNALLYLLVGGGIGAVVALLFAPKPGTQLRSDISEVTKKKYDETLAAASQLKQKTSELYQAAKDKTDRAYEFAAAKLNRSKDEIGETLAKEADQISGEILETRADKTLPGSQVPTNIV